MVYVNDTCKPSGWTLFPTVSLIKGTVLREKECFEGSRRKTLHSVCALIDSFFNFLTSCTDFRLETCCSLC
jgi:hypothetical protein